MQKNFIAKNFRGPPFRPQNFSGPPFLPRKLRVNPIEKHVNSIFTEKFVVIFFKPPLTRVKTFKGPPFCIRPPPLTSVCEWSLSWIYSNIFLCKDYVKLQTGVLVTASGMLLKIVQIELNPSLFTIAEY